MIGGGVLAFTCLGIQWKNDNSDCRFLILDPHYVGSDDWKEVTESKHRMEGYSGYCCSWKSSKEVFEDRYFYRLCLPSRPSICYKCL
ncbi:ubiquitin fold modifier-specific peptidase [Blastocystis sp. subtype 4]|uniref:ubiquitin fold modifier-specific peptidase n=1 Tax=Blastocystis sp. subtype 4 TaxID=944170 RepID=UPI0007117C96|nr:ubiquitin fold modifier-specific peptidase [Blastocystis sp. subtype 4]KNB42632.1 ubiquitin fold modifier-specific peptidase [Blastocystis sp. subtype 4]|eukprot:XP_014526075.1 ubiquitin fold modifier-specific peptidase [Blastocystis sp. subtype 4]